VASANGFATRQSIIQSFCSCYVSGYANIKAENVRTQYNKDATKLNPNDKQGRVELKEKARANTPEPFKSVIEQSRPMAGEKTKAADPNFKGNATKTNAEVNEVAKTTGTLGKVFTGAAIVQSTVTIATSDNPARESLTEGAGWAGAIYVGGQFAAAMPGPPQAKAVAGAFGSVVGFVGGKKLGDEVLRSGENIKLTLKEYNNNYPVEQAGNLIYHICFTEGTLINSKYEFLAIEKIRVGDSVYSYNFEKEELTLSKVINVLNRVASELYEIKVADEIINVTAEHPFYVVGNGWVKAKDLKKGYILKTANNNKNTVSDVTKRNVTVNVYNIEVDGSHNYFVTQLRVLVHNKNISEVVK
jgi:hypothetical protein